MIDMKPIKKNTRKAYANGPSVSVVNIHDLDAQSSSDNFDLYNETGSTEFLANNSNAEILPNESSDEEIKITSLNQAISIAKLMSDIDVDDVLTIAAKVAKFLKGK